MKINNYITNKANVCKSVMDSAILLTGIKMNANVYFWHSGLSDRRVHFSFALHK